MTGGVLLGRWGAFSPKDFFFRSECNSNKPNAFLYPELKYRDCCCSDRFHKYGSHAFWFAKKSNFKQKCLLFSGERSVPLGALVYYIFIQNSTSRNYDDEGSLFLPTYLWMIFKLINNDITCLETCINTMHAAISTTFSASAIIWTFAILPFIHNDITCLEMCINTMHATPFTSFSTFVMIWSLQ